MDSEKGTPVTGKSICTAGVKARLTGIKQQLSARFEEGCRQASALCSEMKHTTKGALNGGGVVNRECLLLKTEDYSA